MFFWPSWPLVLEVLSRELSRTLVAVFKMKAQKVCWTGSRLATELRAGSVRRACEVKIAWTVGDDEKRLRKRVWGVGEGGGQEDKGMVLRHVTNDESTPRRDRRGKRHPEGRGVVTRLQCWSRDWQVWTDHAFAMNPSTLVLSAHRFGIAPRRISVPSRAQGKLR